MFIEFYHDDSVYNPIFPCIDCKTKEINDDMYLSTLTLDISSFTDIIDDDNIMGYNDDRFLKSLLDNVGRRITNRACLIDSNGNFLGIILYTIEELDFNNKICVIDIYNHPIYVNGFSEWLDDYNNYWSVGHIYPLSNDYHKITTIINEILEE